MVIRKLEVTLVVCPVCDGSGLGAIGQRLDRFGDDGPSDGGVGVIACVRRDGEAGAIRKLADHRLGHGNFRVIELRLVFEDRDGQGMDRVRQMSRRSEGVVSATGNARQSKSNQQK